MHNPYRKLYDIGIDAPAAAAEPDIAKLMATQGVRTDAGDNAAPPVVPNIKTDAPATPASAGPEPAPPTAPGEIPKATGEPARVPEKGPEPAPQLPITPSQPSAIPASQPIDWKEALKKAPSMLDALKELGFDDKMAGLFHTWSSGGSLQPYLEAVTVDYTKMSNEDLMKHQLYKDFGADLSPEDFQLLYQMRVTEQYKLDPQVFTEDEVKRGKILLNADAKKVREALIAGQQQFILNSKPPAPQPSQLETELQSQLRQAEEAGLKFRTAVEGSDFTKAFLSSKKFAIGEGADAFNYEVPDPQALTNFLNDGKAWAKAYSNSDDTYNVRKLLLYAAMSTDDNFLNLFAQHHQKIGARNAIAPIENASQPPSNANPSTADDTNPVAALVKRGVITEPSR